MTTADPAEVHAAWLPPEAFRALGSRRILVCADGTLADTVFREVAQACDRYGGSARRGPPGAADSPPAGGDQPRAVGTPFDLILALASTRPLPAAAATVRTEFRRRCARCTDTPGDDGFALARHGDVTVVMADRPTGLLYGLFHLVRLGESAFGAARPMELHRPTMGLRMVDHWDNLDVHPVMGQVESGYAGGSLFWRDGVLRRDLSRVPAYGRLLRPAASTRSR